MQVTEVQIVLIKPKNGMIGFANVVLDDSLYISSIGIHRKLNGSGHRLTYPTRRTGTGQQSHIFHPIRKEMSKALEAAIFCKLKDVMSHDNAGYNSDYLETERV
jgi:DNA-binding cell septation regulator SpoVG